MGTDGLAPQGVRTHPLPRLCSCVLLLPETGLLGSSGPGCTPINDPPPSNRRPYSENLPKTSTFPRVPF